MIISYTANEFGLSNHSDPVLTASHQQCKCAQPNEGVLLFASLRLFQKGYKEYLQNLVSRTIDILKVLSVSKCNYSICVKIYT